MLPKSINNTGCKFNKLILDVTKQHLLLIGQILINRVVLLLGLSSGLVSFQYISVQVQFANGLMEQVDLLGNSCH